MNGTSTTFISHWPIILLTTRVMTFEVGILRPNWLDGATFLGEQTLGGKPVNVWTKVSSHWMMH